jgi:DNA-directed RNA polymerase beta' subunit
MQLQLLDVNRFIDNKGLQEVTSTKPPSAHGFELGSLWDPQIFGQVGSFDRRSRFAYINLKTKLIHPQAYSILKSTSESINKIMSQKAAYVVQNKKYIEDETGETGLSFLIRTLNDVDITTIAKKDKIADAEFLQKNKRLILVDKWVVMPAGSRDIDISRKNAQATMSEVNEFYKRLIYLSGEISGEESYDAIIIDKLQKTLQQIISWVKDSLKGKKGVFRSNMLKKTLDYSTRLVLTSSPGVNLGEIGLPWSTLVLIYEPIISHYVFKDDSDILPDIKKSMNNENNIDYHDLHKFLESVNKNPDLIDIDLKTKLINIVNIIIKDAQVICKRDPAASRDSWFAAKPIITDGRVAVVSSLDLKPIGGDCDGDTLEILPLFTEEAKEQAKKTMNPQHSKSKWNNTINSGRSTYSINDDAVSTIFATTM